MRNVAPSQSLSRFATGAFAVSVAFIAVGALCAIVSFFLKAVPLVAPSSPSAQGYKVLTDFMIIGGGLIAVIGVGLAIRAVFWYRKTDNDLARMVGDLLAQRLDKRFTLIRNINKWGTGYVDAALIGPPGILVLRILDATGAFVNEGEHWVSMDRKGQWVPARIKPTREVTEDIKAMRDFLAARKLPDVPIFGAIVFIRDDPAVKLTLKEPVVPATHLSSLFNRLQGNYLAKDRIDQRTVGAIVSELFDV